MSITRKLIKELRAVWDIGGLGCLLEYVGQIALKLPWIVRRKTLSAADEAMGGRVRSFKVCGRRILLDGNLFAGAREIYGRKVYFALPDFEIRAGDVVVDLGANAGVFTTLAGQVAGKVIAVEAQSGLIAEIRSNVERNNCSHKVSTEFAILGAGSGYFSDNDRLKAGSHFGRMPPPRSMAEILDRHGVQTVDFLKVDIEGSEFDLFAGDLAWLSRVEKIAMEVHPEFGKADQLVQALQEHGFWVWLLDNEQRVVGRLNGPAGYLFAVRDQMRST